MLELLRDRERPKGDNVSLQAFSKGKDRGYGKKGRGKHKKKKHVTYGKGWYNTWSMAKSRLKQKNKANA